MLDQLGRGNRPVLTQTEVDEERAFSAYCREQAIVGFGHGLPVVYPLFADANSQAEQVLGLIREHAQRSGKAPPSPVHMRRARGHLGGIDYVRQGYAGWLMTNVLFRKEALALRRAWRGHLAELPVNASVWQSPVQTQRGQYRRVEHLCRFCERWRIERLASWELPVPLGPELPVVNVALSKRRLESGGLTFFLPDTFPIPSREQIRAVGLDVQRARQQRHLASWIHIVRREGNDAGVQRYARWFVVQHYWALISARYGKRLQARVGTFDSAMAGHLSCGTDAIRKYRRAIRSSLGFDPKYPL